MKIPEIKQPQEEMNLVMPELKNWVEPELNELDLKSGSFFNPGEDGYFSSII